MANDKNRITTTERITSTLPVVAITKAVINSATKIPNWMALTIIEPLLLLKSRATMPNARATISISPTTQMVVMSGLPPTSLRGTSALAMPAMVIISKGRV